MTDAAIDTGVSKKKAVKIIDSPLNAIGNALNAMLVSIRTRHPEVPNVMLVVGPSGRTARGGLNLGHFAPKSWESKSASHEIVISGESLKNGAEDVLGTMLHECAHALAEARGIKDTSRQGRFHNRRFKTLAEELGIVVANDPKIGWSPTTVPAATATLYKAELSALRKSLKGYRIEKLNAKAPKTTVRLECDCRGLTVPIKFNEEGGLSCDICGGAFLPVE